MNPSATASADGLPRSSHTGLVYGTVRLTDHDPGWTATFDQLHQQIRESLGDLALAVEHVGSTAVPALKAKPIIDIVVGINTNLSGAVEKAMAGSGWLFRGDKGDHGGPLFVYEPQPQVRIAHAHTVQYQGSAWNDYLAFRDLPRVDAAARQQYEELKQRLAAEYSADRAAYTAGKQALVRQLLGR